MGDEVVPLSAIVVSRDRPSQLDLLLRSVTCNAPDLLDSIAVLWTSSNGEYAAGYGICISDHPECDFYSEGDFRSDVNYLVDGADNFVMFLTDDSYFYRESPEVDPCAVLHSEINALCFSLRLGRNTGTCYPLKGRFQHTPDFEDGGGYLVWDWRTGDADFGYPGSLDGHIFRRNDLLRMIRTRDDWWNPNTLEDVLSRAVYDSPRNLMCSFDRSILVGIPANRTSTSHPGNRFGEVHLVDHAYLNDEYLNGGRIQFPHIHPDAVTGAHQEMSLEVM